LSENYIDGIMEIIEVISRRSEDITPDTYIIRDGYIDSLNIFQIIIEIENRFNVSIGIMDAIVEDFSTPNTILALVNRLKSK